MVIVNGEEQSLTAAIDQQARALAAIAPETIEAVTTWDDLAASIALVIALITLILNGSADAFLKAIFGVVGVIGLSAATIQAGLKTTAQGLLSRLRQDA